MSRQMPLNLGFRQNLDFASFVSGENSACLAYLQQLGEGRGEKISYLWGPAGVGKSHLLHALARESSRHHRRVAFLPLEDAAAFDPAVVESLEEYDLVCLDNIHLVCGERKWQEALFHLINRQIEQDNHALAITANQPVSSLGIELKDLQSRLAWGVVFQLHELSDENKTLALNNKARSKGFEFGSGVLDYLFRHYVRDLPSMLLLLDRIDQASLSEQRRITVPFVKKILQQES